MRVLIVDDERLARQELRRLLGVHREVQIVGEASGIDEAERALEELTPDLILLDIEMPGGNGFDLLERLEWLPDVVFTTAYDDYAVKAFEVNALDYLVKPIEPARLEEALAKVTARRAGRLREQERRGERLTAGDRIFVRDGKRCWLVRLADIVLFESEGNYTRLHFGDERPLVRRSLRTLNDRLDPAVFFLANRRQVVNLGHVVSIEPLEQGRMAALMEGNIEVELSRRRARLLQRLLGL